MTSPPDSIRLDDHVVVAYNTATASTNKIHDDDVARTFGFRGGLVPGVDVYAYLTHLPVRHWGREWLERGAMRAGFAKPMYDGREVTVTGVQLDDALELAVMDGDVACATGNATWGPSLAGSPAPPRADLPTDPPPAAPEVLQPGTVLGTVVDRFDAAAHTSYLADVRETLPLYADEGIAHPGWLLRFANSALARNVVLGPWIHVSSDLDLLGVVSDGETVEARSIVVDEFERKGHRFVTLDVALSADERPVQRIRHTAIYRPRAVAADPMDSQRFPVGRVSCSGMANDPANREELHDAVAARLRTAGQRYTSGRRQLVELLADAERPETIPELLERAPSLAQSSAYRNLVVLEEASVAHRVVTSDERSRYELAEDLMGHHHHLICTSCGRVDDFTVSAQMERSLEGALERAVAGTGFRAAAHRLDVIGTCESCA